MLQCQVRLTNEAIHNLDNEEYVLFYYCTVETLHCWSYQPNTRHSINIFNEGINKWT